METGLFHVPFMVSLTTSHSQDISISLNKKKPLSHMGTAEDRNGVPRPEESSNP